MSVGNPVYRRFHQNNWNFCLILAEQMIAFKDERTVNLVAQANQNSTFDVANHSPHAMLEKIGAAAGWRMELRIFSEVKKDYQSLLKYWELLKILSREGSVCSALELWLVVPVMIIH